MSTLARVARYFWWALVGMAVGWPLRTTRLVSFCFVSSCLVAPRSRLGLVLSTPLHSSCFRCLPNTKYPKLVRDDPTTAYARAGWANQVRMSRDETRRKEKRMEADINNLHDRRVICTRYPFIYSTLHFTPRSLNRIIKDMDFWRQLRVTRSRWRQIQNTRVG